ncbi:MAG: hypothetical protein ACKO0Z_15050 [Betaproteobacteria bacterium]
MSDILSKFTDPNGPALTPAEKKRLHERMMRKYGMKGHAGTPGNGPSEETCRTCQHYTLKVMSTTYRKCGLMKQYWTGGLKTDIRAGDPACEKWEKRDGK